MSYGKHKVEHIINKTPHLSTDVSGNPVLLGADGVIIPTLGANAITVGAGGMFATLEEAIAYRVATYPHTVVAPNTITVTGTVSGTVAKHQFTLGTAIAGYSANDAMYGIRIGGATAPIIPCRMRTNTIGYLEYPFPADFTDTACEVMRPVRSNVVLLPGTHLNISTDVLLPDYTTFCALIPGTSSIKTYGGAGALVTQILTNKTRFTGLLLEDIRHGNLGQMIKLIKSVADNIFVPLCDIQFDNNELRTGTNDLIYTTLAGSIGITAFNNKAFGTYDIFRLGTHRKALIHDNEITVKSLVVIDGEAATGCVFGSAGAASWDYPDQLHVFSGNTVHCYTETNTTADGWATATGVSIRGGVNTANSFVVSGNTFDLTTNCETAITGTPYYGYSSIALSVGDVGESFGAETPQVVFKDNAVRSRKTGAQAATLPAAVVSSSLFAGVPVLSSGNTVFGGGSTTAGTNVTAATTY